MFFWIFLFDQKFAQFAKKNHQIFLDIIEFDNYYSWLCAKQIRYTVSVQEPKHATFDIVQQTHLTAAAGLCVSH